MYPNEQARLVIAFGTLLLLALLSRGLTPLTGPEVPVVIAVVMGVGALPALMLHWVCPARPGRQTLLAAAVLALPGLALALQLWTDWLITRGVHPTLPLIGLALGLAFVQAVALRSDRRSAAMVAA